MLKHFQLISLFFIFTNAVGIREKMISDDLVYSIDAPKNRLIINSYMVVDELDIDTFRNFVRTELIATQPKFSQRVVIEDGQYYWEQLDEEDWDFDAHVYEMDASSKDGQAWTETDMFDWIGEIYNKEMKYGAPLFEFILIPLMGGKSGIVMRFHHFMGDGNAIVSTMLNALKDSENLSREEKQDRSSKLGKKKNHWLRHAYTLLGVPMEIIKGVLSWTDRNVLHGANVISGIRRVAKTNRIELTTVKAIKTYYECTVNDVLLAALTGAFRSYFLSHGMTESEISSTKVGMPISLRTKKEMENIKLENKITVIPVPLPTYATTPLARLFQTRSIIQGIKHSSLPMVNYALMQSVKLIPLNSRTEVLAKEAGKVTSIVSNVHGPDTPIKLEGSAVQEMGFFVPSAGNVGVGVSFFSYNGKITVGVTCDMYACEDPQELVRLIEDEIETYTELVSNEEQLDFSSFYDAMEASLNA